MERCGRKPGHRRRASFDHEEVARAQSNVGPRPEPDRSAQASPSGDGLVRVGLPASGPSLRHPRPQGRGKAQGHTSGSESALAALPDAASSALGAKQALALCLAPGEEWWRAASGHGEERRAFLRGATRPAPARQPPDTRAPSRRRSSPPSRRARGMALVTVRSPLTTTHEYVQLFSLICCSCSFKREMNA